jgi:hypothetical protein
MKTQFNFFLLLLTIVIFQCKSVDDIDPLPNIRYLFPEGREATISNSDFTSIRFEDGMLLSIPPHSFETETNLVDSIRLVLSVDKELQEGKKLFTFEIHASHGDHELKAGKKAGIYVEFPCLGMVENNLLRWERKGWKHYAKSTTEMIPFPMKTRSFHTTCNGHEDFMGLRTDLENIISQANFFSTREFVNRYQVNACEYEQIQVFKDNLNKPLEMSDRILAERYEQGAKTMKTADSLSIRYQLVLAEVSRYFESFHLQQPWTFPVENQSESADEAWRFFSKYKNKKRNKMMSLWIARHALMDYLSISESGLETNFFPTFIGATGKYGLMQQTFVYISPGERIGAFAPFR